VFSEEAAQHFPPKRPWDHTIDLKPDALNIIDCKVYHLTQEEDKALVAFLEEQLKKGYIVPSISPYASPFFFVKKKDSKLRLVQDYRKLNEYTIQNRIPFHLSLTLSVKCRMHTSSPSLMYDGDTITSKSKWVMKRKQHSRPDMVFLNHGLCSLAL